MIAGVAVLAVSFIDESLSSASANLLAAQVGVAVGAALIYGAEEAWIAGELPDTEVTHVYVRGAQIGLVGTVAGSLGSGVLILAGRSMPLLVGGLGMGVLAGALVVVMPEHFLTDIRFPVGLRPGMWFGLVAAVVALLVVGSTELAKRQAARSGGSRVSATIATILAVTCAAVVGMVLTHRFALALIAYLVAAAVRPASGPLINGWMVTRVDPGVRATALSAQGMCDSAGQIAGGPIFGLLGTIASIRIALLAGAAVLVPAVGLLASPGRRATLSAHQGARLPEPPTESTEPFHTSAGVPPTDRLARQPRPGEQVKNQGLGGTPTPPEDKTVT